MSYIASLSPKQKQNLDLLVRVLNDSSVTNKYAQAAILSIIAKESQFNLKEEKSYAGTSNDRIRQIFGRRVADLSDAKLTDLKHHDVAFFEKVYGVGSGVPLGNTQVGDGWKYRGRGFNQITGRGNYTFYGKNIGKDLANHPELLNDPEIAAKAAIQFFIIESMKKSNKLGEYNAKSINDFENLTDSTGALFHANAGWGHSKQDLLGDPTGGYTKAMNNVQEFYDYIGGEKKSLFLNWKIWLALFLLIVIWFFFLRGK